MSLRWVWLLLLALGCSAEEDAAGPDATDEPPPKGGAAGSAGVKLDGPGADGGCSDTTDLAGCSCSPGAAPRSCEPSGGTCSTGTQSCEKVMKGEVAAGEWGPCLPTCPSCEAGSTTFAEPGSFDFEVPDHETLTVKVWGAGGGGKAYAPVDEATKGGDSSFDGKVIAGGGESGATGLGGVAKGGAINTPGGNGAPPCDQGPPVLCSMVPGGGFHGGDAPLGGKGAQTLSVLDGCSGGDGKDGEAPGGGGAGSYTCQMTWWLGTGWGFSGRGAGAGAFASTSYAKGQLSVGAKLAVVVGAGGLGSKGAMTSGFPGQGKNAGHYTAGNGGHGRVEISWTCP